MEILLAVFAAVGACTVLAALVLLILAPMTARHMVTIWHVRDETADLEYRVRLCLLLQKMGLLSARLVLVDCGLKADARKRAEILCREQPLVDLVSRCDLDTYFDMVSVE